MMLRIFRKRLLSALIAPIVVFLGLQTVFAEEVPPPQEEAISSFFSEIRVGTDNAIDVTETIRYQTGSAYHHGIYRDVFVRSSNGKVMSISNVAVTALDDRGGLQPFTTEMIQNFLRIRIGDPNSTFTGERIYRISYHATHAVDQRQDIDELYWNVTGNNWGFPIYSVSATIILPQGVFSKQSACYQGVKGSKELCVSPQASSSETYFFSATRKLLQGEGLTVAVGFNKGGVIPYTQEELVNTTTVQQNVTSLNQSTPQLLFFSTTQTIGSIVFLVALFSVMYVYWYKKWRDPKGRGVIVVEYDVPDNLTPLEVDAIANETLSSSGISAEIIYLATQGYITIKQIETKVIFGITATDYELYLVRNDTYFLSEFDKSLISSLFKKDSYRVQLSDLQGEFYLSLHTIFEKVGAGLVMKGYYENLGRLKYSSKKVAIQPLGVGFLAFPAIFFLIISVGNGYSSNSLISFFAPFVFLFLCFLVIFIFWNLSPKKSPQGVSMMEYLLGLKLYLSVAEKERLAFHNAPEKKPEIFEKLLPYAMVFGVEEAWAKEFEGIYTTPPSWYEGNSHDAFTSSSFATAVSGFSSVASSAFAPPSSSDGGSGGGGSSAGGGGGGGGGSW
jgi:uncharacterized membrane protein